jgi:hypothetical protein
MEHRRRGPVNLKNLSDAPEKLAAEQIKQTSSSGETPVNIEVGEEN